MLTGNKVYLRLMEYHDIPLKVEWVNDEEIRDMIISDYISEAGTRQWFGKLLENNTRKEFMICLKETHQPIGFISIKNIDFINYKAELSMLLGNKSQWGKGYAKEARKIIIAYIFNEMGLNKIYSYNWIDNKRIIGLNKKLGFKIDGELRDDIFFKGNFRTIVVMSLLKKDWEIAVKN